MYIYVAFLIETIKNSSIRWVVSTYHILSARSLHIKSILQR